MVAGMLMPLGQLRAIYELLFRDGVLVAQKDPRPQSLHPQLPGVSNLQVRRAMASLRSRGLVRENFAWRHSYWYLTDEGIAHLRQYLRLPPEIVPATLQRVRRPVATAARPAYRPPRVQAAPGVALTCPPKPQEGSRQAYRRKEEDPTIVPVARAEPVRAAPGVASDSSPTEEIEGWGADAAPDGTRSVVGTPAAKGIGMKRSRGHKVGEEEMQGRSPGRGTGAPKASLGRQKPPSP
ncbi:hypothetical protein JD844_015335 [Phrynosoma platyrhinos]|uniref:Plectin/eS10 N-terminal domain-containing protein n=1 Tax=Phrynosoma platyrhinos TaxID=52577 RepID=A0ABQ7SJ02_PHRPL|nr:hypothetical protein JD844_015335 [Phrynosoma platyrhinos]